jgi:NADPH2:quinone reductase
MKALVCSRLGGPEDLGIEDLPDPVAGPGEALVRSATVMPARTP